MKESKKPRGLESLIFCAAMILAAADQARGKEKGKYDYPDITYPEIVCNMKMYFPATAQTGWKNGAEVAKVKYPYLNKDDFLVPSGFMQDNGFKFAVKRKRDSKNEHITDISVIPSDKSNFDVYSAPSGKTGCNVNAKPEILQGSDTWGDDVKDEKEVASSPPQTLRLCFVVDDKKKAGDTKDVRKGYEGLCTIKHNPQRDKERVAEKNKSAVGPDGSTQNNGSGTGAVQAKDSP